MNDDDDYCEHKQISHGRCLACGEWGHLAPGDEEGVLPGPEDD